MILILKAGVAPAAVSSLANFVLGVGVGHISFAATRSEFANKYFVPPRYTRSSQ